MKTSSASSHSSSSSSLMNSSILGVLTSEGPSLPSVTRKSNTFNPGGTGRDFGGGGGLGARGGASTTARRVSKVSGGSLGTALRGTRAWDLDAVVMDLRCSVLGLLDLYSGPWVFWASVMQL